MRVFAAAVALAMLVPSVAQAVDEETYSIKLEIGGV
jgi:hypothetical protein